MRLLRFNALLRQLLLSAAVLLAGCVTLPDIPKTPPQPDDPQVSTNRLRFTRFAFLRADNPGLERDMVCAVGDGSGTIIGSLQSGVDPSDLVATFEVAGQGQVSVVVDREPQSSGQTHNDFSDRVYYTLQDEREIRTYQCSFVPWTGLPVLVIETADSRMPTSRDKWVGATLSLDGMGSYDRIPSEGIEIKRRGNSTFGFPKKAFNIRFSSKKEVLGMKKHKRWVLLANYRDRTLLRNDVALYMGRHLDGLEWTPDARYVELVFNGQHVGNYQVVEQIRVDKNRVDIDEMTAEDLGGDALTGGYLLELDKYYGDTHKFRSQLENLPVNIKSPDEELLQPLQLSYIEDYIDTVERMLANGDYDRAFEEMLDIDSFIDYWLVYEIVGNTELHGPFSSYMYKRRAGKLYAGPIWDFDYATFRQTFTSKILITDYVWYKYLFLSDRFRRRVVERFRSALPFLETVPDYIRTRAGELDLSAERNWEIWPDLVDNARGNGDEDMTPEEAVDAMIVSYRSRLATVSAFVDELDGMLGN